MFYGTRLKALRERIGLTQQKVADILMLDLSTYGMYEIEKDIMPIKHLNTLVNYYNVSLDYIFGFSDEVKYKDIRENIDKELSGARLKALRKNSKITQTKFGEKLNCSYGTIAGYESGRYIIATPFLYSICKDYGVSADYLLGKIDVMCPKNLKIGNKE